MKKIFLAIAVLCLLVSGCSSKAPNQSTESQQESPQIADYDILTFDESAEIEQSAGSEYCTVKLYATNNGNDPVKMVRPTIKVYREDGSTICTGDGTLADAIEPGEKLPICVMLKTTEKFSKFKVCAYAYETKPMDGGINYVMLDLVMDSVSFGRIS